MSLYVIYTVIPRSSDKFKELAKEVGKLTDIQEDSKTTIIGTTDDLKKAKSIVDKGSIEIKEHLCEFIDDYELTTTELFREDEEDKVYRVNVASVSDVNAPRFIFNVDIINQL